MIPDLERRLRGACWFRRMRRPPAWSWSVGLVDHSALASPPLDGGSIAFVAHHRCEHRIWYVERESHDRERSSIGRA